ncbi:unnamed protein product [Malus baccata var. baccata]
MVEEEEEVLYPSGDIAEEKEPEKGCCGALCTPIQWFRMLCVELHWSFVLGVVVVYGVSQGLGGALYRVGTEYYMKDVQKVQPSEAQFYQGITNIPWLVKPLWGLLTDVLPIFGYRRRPYFIIAEEEEEVLDPSGDTAYESEPKKGCCGALCTPIQWFKMLCVELHWSFVWGVVVVYGISQGLGDALSRIGTEYYMKDVQKVQPSEAQFYRGIIYIPWIVKPIWGLLTDVLPIFGYRRRPYFIFAGIRLSYTRLSFRN